MLFVRAGLVVALAATLSASPLLASRTHRAPTSGHAKSSARKAKGAKVVRSKASVKAPAKPKGQRGIDPDRTREIQSALIRENYLTGEPSGQWDSETQSAMQRYQADHGWQTKLTPDSRALIKLGLGPNHSANSINNASGNSQQSSTGAGSMDSARTLRSSASLY